MSKLVYIASPYSSHDPILVERNFRVVTEYCAKRMASGEVLLSPITYGHTLLEFEKMPNDWEFWQNFCLSVLVKCDELRVLKMPGWELSTGVAAEIKFAEDNDIPIEYIEEFEV